MLVQTSSGLLHSDRGWCIKFATELNTKIDICSSKSILVIKLSFCQNDPPMRESFWQKDSLITHIIFELQPIIIFCPVANFGDQSKVSTETILFGFGNC